jgi:hypothetical protein
LRHGRERERRNAGVATRWTGSEEQCPTGGHSTLLTPVIYAIPAWADLRVALFCAVAISLGPFRLEGRCCCAGNRVNRSSIAPSLGQTPLVHTAIARRNPTDRCSPQRHGRAMDAGSCPAVRLQAHPVSPSPDELPGSFVLCLRQQPGNYVAPPRRLGTAPTQCQAVRLVTSWCHSAPGRRSSPRLDTPVGD